ncbi:MAG: peptide chain release factor 1 [Patescibacteria group bacterium]|nr:peptide chain release factor 1 [Patescibacteria group bacterium]
MDLQSLKYKLTTRIEKLEQDLNSGKGDLVKKSQELSVIKEKNQLIENYLGLEKRIHENEELTDPEIKELAQIENEELKLKLIDAKKIMLEKLLADSIDQRNTIVEIHAGTGGDEAELFAEELMRMYLRYADILGFKAEILDIQKTGLGGIKETKIEIKGNNSYGIFKFEGGVHRVQRIPITEKKGRIHTSATGVIVLPEAKNIDVAIKPEDLRIDVYRSSGPGGQSVNTTDSAVRITHLPTNTVVTCQDEKSQLKNKEKAIKILRSRLLALEIEKKAQENKIERKSMVNTLDRSEKIRTYNYPQNRVTDHRINYTSHNLEKILAGELNEMTNALREAEIQNKLASLNEKL